MKKILCRFAIFGVFLLISCNQGSTSSNPPAPQQTTPSNNSEGQKPTPTPARPKAQFPPKTEIKQTVTALGKIKSYVDALDLSMKDNDNNICIPGAVAALAGFHFELDHEISQSNVVELGTFDDGINQGPLITFFQDTKDENQPTWKWYFEMESTDKKVAFVYFRKLQWSKVNEGTIDSPKYIYKYMSQGIGKCDPNWDPNQPN